ncbi:hypothetical protein [Chryseobacterium defluvii]|uniref:Uncharacterized protein n=1 Tax=Chryseobacterium defluvii TaxID=160396 RepID=A0A495SQB1_9FLAO|nr:hypothetical protein [Chryseobacterium defluvii]RKT01590.1 hypothetical protein BCF58_0813 [Chryseobacterium defluvii]
MKKNNRNTVIRKNILSISVAILLYMLLSVFFIIEYNNMYSQIFIILLLALLIFISVTVKLSYLKLDILPENLLIREQNILNHSIMSTKRHLDIPYDYINDFKINKNTLSIHVKNSSEVSKLNFSIHCFSHNEKRKIEELLSERIVKISN